MKSRACSHVVLGIQKTFRWVEQDDYNRHTESALVIGLPTDLTTVTNLILVLTVIVNSVVSI